MAELPHPWDAYASAQAQLSNRTQISDRAWGLEATLNCLVTGQAPDPGALPTVQANAERRARYGRSLVTRNAGVLAAEAPSTGAQMDARSALLFLGRHLSTQDMRALVAMGLGHKAVLDVARQRLSRARRRARMLLGG